MQSSQQPHVAPVTDWDLGALIDNKALINRIQKSSHNGLVGTLAPGYDPFQVAQQGTKKYNILVVPAHINKSHQGD